MEGAGGQKRRGFFGGAFPSCEGRESELCLL